MTLLKLKRAVVFTALFLIGLIKRSIGCKTVHFTKRLCEARRAVAVQCISSLLRLTGLPRRLMFFAKTTKAVVFTALFLIGCSSDQLRINKAFDLARQTNFTPSVINTSNFPIQIFTQNHNSKHAIIYLEGDGLVINKYGDVALNSTPTDPMALRLASVDPRPLTKIVINRPFHYVKSVDPNSKYWTTARYAPEVIQSIYEAIKQCQQQFHFETVELVAYSGGASVALLLTLHVKNITRIVSFAGNLDHKSWTRYHGAGLLLESLDPMENMEAIRHIPQMHFLGSNDDNTTVKLAQAYKQRVNSDKISIVPIDGFDHDSNWPRVWQEWLLKEQLPTTHRHPELVSGSKKQKDPEINSR